MEAKKMNIKTTLENIVGKYLSEISDVDFETFYPLLHEENGTIKGLVSAEFAHEALYPSNRADVDCEVVDCADQIVIVKDEYAVRNF